MTNTDSGMMTIQSIWAAPGQDVFVRSTALINVSWLTVSLVNLAHLNNFQGGLFISGTALEFTLEEYEPGVYYIEAADDDDLLATLTSNEANTQVCSLFTMECENANDEWKGYLAPQRCECWSDLDLHSDLRYKCQASLLKELVLVSLSWVSIPRDRIVHPVSA